MFFCCLFFCCFFFASVKFFLRTIYGLLLRFFFFTFPPLNKTNCFILHNTIKPLHVQYQCPITDYMCGKLHVSQISCIKKIWVFYWKEVNITDEQKISPHLKTTSTTKGKNSINTMYILIALYPLSEGRLGRCLWNSIRLIRPSVSWLNQLASASVTTPGERDTFPTCRDVFFFFILPRFIYKTLPSGKTEQQDYSEMHIINKMLFWSYMVAGRYKTGDNSGIQCSNNSILLWQSAIHYCKV